MIRHDGDQWHLWASVHPLDDPDATDRMTTEHATSPDGVEWTWQGTALAGRPGAWDARGARFATVVLDGPPPGRSTTAAPPPRRTSRSAPAWPACTPAGPFTAVGDGPLLQSPHPPHGLRYADVVALPGGGARWFYEATRADGGHELRTVLLPSLTGHGRMRSRGHLGVDVAVHPRTAAACSAATPRSAGRGIGRVSAAATAAASDTGSGPHRPSVP